MVTSLRESATQFSSLTGLHDPGLTHVSAPPRLCSLCLAVYRSDASHPLRRPPCFPPSAVPAAVLLPSCLGPHACNALPGLSAWLTATLQRPPSVMRTAPSRALCCTPLGLSPRPHPSSRRPARSCYSRPHFPDEEIRAQRY